MSDPTTTAATGITPVGQQPDLQPPRGGFNTPPRSVEDIAAAIERAILDRATTWETTFNAGPGQVVSVKDAAIIAAQEVVRGSEQLDTAAALPGHLDPWTWRTGELRDHLGHKHKRRPEMLVGLNRFALMDFHKELHDGIWA